MATTPSVRYRVGFIQGFLITSIAVFFDAVGFILMLTGIGEVVTEMVGFVGSILFPVWFMFLGAKLLGKNAAQKIGTLSAGSIVELIPFLNGFSPTFTIETVAMIYIMRTEDQKKAAEEAARKSVQVSVEAKRAAAYQEAVARQRIQAANDNEEGQLQEAA